MKLTVFQSNKGDCLLLSSEDNKHMLIDGGMKKSYKKHVAPNLNKVTKKKALDIVYLSHIDQDHINGILQLMDDLVAWRVYDYHEKIDENNKRFKKPRLPRPPEVKAIWQNSFTDLIGESSRPIQEMLSSNMELISMDSGAIGEEVSGHAFEYQNIVYGVSDAVKLNNRVGAQQLNIPLNPEFKGKMMALGSRNIDLRLGEIRFSLLGPAKEDIKKLQKEWVDWLRENKKAVRKIRKSAKKDRKLFASEGDWVLSNMRSLASELGNRKKVSPPNLASIMLLAEENGKSILLTGDGHHADILKGLKAHNKLDENGRIHASVLKVQHHGSEHNIDENFCRLLTADHYVFCSNGAHENPDLEVLKIIIDSRLNAKHDNPNVRKKFKFWFNSSSNVTQGNNQKHMRKVEKLIILKARRSNGQMRYRFLRRGSKFRVSFNKEIL